eukprot:12620081-Heterocapsa_arctica.AAC.1
MTEDDLVRFCVHNNVPLDKDKVVTALPADDGEEGAIEAIRLQQGDLVPGDVGGTDAPGNPEDAQEPSPKDLKANA